MRARASFAERLTRDSGLLSNMCSSSAADGGREILRTSVGAARDWGGITQGHECLAGRAYRPRSFKKATE